MSSFLWVLYLLKIVVIVEINTTFFRAEIWLTAVIFIEMWVFMISLYQWPFSWTIGSLPDLTFKFVWKWPCCCKNWLEWKVLTLQSDFYTSQGKKKTFPQQAFSELIKPWSCELLRSVSFKQRWKVTNYIYSRYCNWVAFLCTSTF